MSTYLQPALEARRLNEYIRVKLAELAQLEAEIAANDDPMTGFTPSVETEVAMESALEPTTFLAEPTTFLAEPTAFVALLGGRGVVRGRVVGGPVVCPEDAG
jgi:hypothetical protein